MRSGDWSVTVAGEVVRVEREDVDKSGRNPKYFYAFVLRPSAPIDAPPGTTLPDEPAFRISGVDLARLVDVPPAAGDRVELTGRASGPRPATIYLTAIRRI